MAVEIEDVKKEFDKYRHDVEELKATVEQQIKDLKTQGRRDPLFEEKLERINGELDRFEQMQAQFRKDQEAAERKRRASETEAQDKLAAMVTARLDENEKKINRVLLGLGGAGSDIESVKLERKAFVDYLRVGESRMEDVERKVLTRSDDAAGGFLAPAQFVADVIKQQFVFSAVREFVRVVPISLASYRRPKLTTSTKPSATRVGETATRAESTNPAYGLTDIPAAELYAEHRVSQQQLEDAAVDMEAELAQFMGWQFANTEGAEFVSGTGVGGQARGILDTSVNTSAIQVVSGSASAITADGLIDLQHTLPSSYARGASFLLNRKTVGQVRKLKVNTSSTDYAWQPSLIPGSPPTILGDRYYEVPDMPDAGTNTFPIAYGMWQLAYNLVDRVGMSILRDPFTLSGSGQIKISARRRVGGDVVLTDAYRVQKCST